VFGQDEGIGARRQAATLDPVDRSVTMEDLVRLVPVFLRTITEKVDVVEVHGAPHWTHVVIHVFRIRHHEWTSSMLIFLT
jgi:hypothetical protein